MGGRGPGAVALILVDLVVHQQPQRLGLGVDREIGSVGDGMQERVGHRPATAAPLVDVKVRAAGVVTPVELLDGGDAGLGGRGLPGVQDLPTHPGPLDGNLPGRAVPLIGPAEVVFQFLVDGEGLAGPVPQPSIVTGGLGPQFVIACLPAHVDHGVDRRAAAEHAAPRVVNAAAGQARIGLGRKAPVGAGVGDGVQIADRHLDPEPVVFAARLDQQHPVLRVGAEPIGEQTARAARSHDDVVEHGAPASRGRTTPPPGT